MTESTEDPGAERPRGRRRRWIELAGIASVVLAAIALIPAFGSWINDLRHNPPDPGQSPSASPPGTTAAATTAAATTAAATTPAAPGWVSLWTVPQLTGRLSDPPDAVRNDAGYRDARFIGCPDNQTTRTHEVTYELGGFYQEVKLTVRAWGDTDRPDRMNLLTFTRTKQRDGTMDKVRREFASVQANGAPSEVTVRTTGVQEFVLQLSCAQPNQRLAVTEARILPA